MAHVKSVPLVRIRVERRAQGFIYLLRDRNNVECGRGMVPADTAQLSFGSAWLHFSLLFPSEELFLHQVSVPAGVRLPNPLKTPGSLAKDITK